VRNVPWGNHGWVRQPRPEGRVLRPEDLVDVDFRYATPGYLDVLGVPRLQGRGLADGDVDGAPRVAVLSTTAARRLWPDGGAIGRRFRWKDQDDSPWIAVVGIVADVNDRPDERGPRPTIYVPFAQEASASTYFVVRTRGAPLAEARAAQAAVFAVDPALPVTEVRTLDLVLADRLAGFRIGNSLMGGFALLALVLAAVGIYGVVATLVAQRTHEIGVRMALGARRHDVLGLVLRRGLFYTALGLGPGLLLAFLLARFMASVLVGAVDDDAVVFVVTALVVTGVALIGTLVPALRATRVDPLIALRDP
jgi:predicted permease